jgi:hypothetical protein
MLAPVPFPGLAAPHRPTHNPVDPAPFRPTCRSTKTMKTQILLGTALLIGIFTNAAEDIRCVTVVATSDSPATVQIQPGETAELVSSVSTIKSGEVQTTFQSKNGRGGQWGFGIPVIGPATITASTVRGNSVFITVKITPDSFDVNKTVILLPGTNQVYITLESSTNFVNWADATNGVYGSPDTARFFRIKMTTLASP